MEAEERVEGARSDRACEREGEEEEEPGGGRGGEVSGRDARLSDVW